MSEKKNEFVRQVAEQKYGEIHEPDLLEDAGVDDGVDPLGVMTQMRVSIDEFHIAGIFLKY